MSIETFLDAAWNESHEAPSNSIASCSTCQSPFDDWEHLDVSTCLKCGTVVARCLDLSAEYRYFSQDDRGGGDPCRVGAPQDNRFPGSSLGTVILATQQGGSANTRWSMNKIRRYHTWNMLPYKERSLLHVFETPADYGHQPGPRHWDSRSQQGILRRTYGTLPEARTLSIRHPILLCFPGAEAGRAAEKTEGGRRHVSHQNRRLHESIQIRAGSSRHCPSERPTQRVLRLSVGPTKHTCLPLYCAPSQQTSAQAFRIPSVPESEHGHFERR